MEDLKGKVVLIDFWTYSCINCLRTLPYLKEWYKKYHDKGFVIVGIHTPEFEFEKDPSNVQEAVTRLGISYPVALDNSYAMWNAYHNHFWPAHYLLNQDGYIVAMHFGEGAYEETEGQIQELLGLSEAVVAPSQVKTRSISPETYLGTNRGKSFTSENHIINDTMTLYTYSKPLHNDQVGLRGEWKAEDERITSESDESFLSMNFEATKVYLVLSGPSKTPLEVYLDGKRVGEIAVDFAQKYDVVETTYGRHQLTLKVPKGVSAYAFTFGGE